MKNKLRPSNVILIVVGALILGALAIWNVSCSQVPTLPMTTPGQPLTPVPLAATEATATSGATTAPRAGATVNLIATPTPTLTAEVLLAHELIRQGGQVVYSADECDKILQSGSSCSVIKSATRITRPEWKELFPRTNFFLVKTTLYGSESSRQSNWLIVEQDGQRYTAKTFDRLLETKGIISITDENREPVARAFALMTIPDYLEEEVIFTKWEEGSWPSSIRLNYNYALTAWTKIQGLEIQWRFLFYEGLLIGANGHVPGHSIGDYIDVPFERLPVPSPDSLTYWRRQ